MVDNTCLIWFDTMLIFDKPSHVAPQTFKLEDNANVLANTLYKFIDKYDLGYTVEYNTTDMFALETLTK